MDSKLTRRAVMGAGRDTMRFPLMVRLDRARLIVLLLSVYEQTEALLTVAVDFVLETDRGWMLLGCFGENQTRDPFRFKGENVSVGDDEQVEADVRESAVIYDDLSDNVCGRGNSGDLRLFVLSKRSRRWLGVWVPTLAIVLPHLILDRAPS